MGSECVPGVDPNSGPKAPSGGSLVDKGKTHKTVSQGMPAKSPGNKDKNKMPSGPQGRG